MSVGTVHATLTIGFRKNTPSATLSFVPKFTPHTTPSITIVTTSDVFFKTTPSLTLDLTPTLVPHTTPSATVDLMLALIPHTTPDATINPIVALTPHTTPSASLGFVPTFIAHTTPQTTLQLIPALTPHSTPSATLGFVLTTIPHTTPSLTIGTPVHVWRFQTSPSLTLQFLTGETPEYWAITVTLTSRGELLSNDNGFPATYHWPPHITTIIGSPTNANDITIVYDYSGGSANWIEEEGIGLANTEEGLGTPEESNLIPSEIAWQWNIRRVRWNGVTTEWKTPVR